MRPLKLRSLMLRASILWTLIALLAAGTLMGCSRISTKSLNASDGILSDRQLAESRQEAPPKPSPCVRWDNAAGRFSKPGRKAKDATVSKDSRPRLQAKNDQPHI
jgi:hypothetical protein